MTLLPLLFTPQVALIGGLTLGVATIGKYCLTGRILGISGTIKGLVTGDVAPWRLAFSGGLIAAGALALNVMPAAFDAIPASYTVSCTAPAAVLAGAGLACRACSSATSFPDLVPPVSAI